MTAWEPITLGTLELKNRIVRAPFQTGNCGEGGTVSERKARETAELAKNEVGLIVTGQMAVLPSGQVSDYQDMMFYQAHVAEQRKVTAAVHAAGGKIVAQINYAGAKASAAVTRGLAPLGPSEFQFAPTSVPARAARVDEIHAIADAFAAAAGRVQEAGFDGVEIHAAHLYFISEFLNPFYNHRTDEYGGSAENRFRLLGEVLEKTRQTVGPDYPVLVKFECNAVENDGGWVKDLIYFANRCAAYGVCALELSGCDYIPRGAKGERLYYLERTAFLKKMIGLPLILEGSVRSLEDIQKVMDAGIDLVAIGRALCCEPDLIPRLKAGQEQASCVSCSQCFAQFLKDGRNCVLHKNEV